MTSRDSACLLRHKNHKIVLLPQRPNRLIMMSWWRLSKNVDFLTDERHMSRDLARLSRHRRASHRAAMYKSYGCNPAYNLLDFATQLSLQSWIEKHPTSFHERPQFLLLRPPERQPSCEHFRFRTAHWPGSPTFAAKLFSRARRRHGWSPPISSRLPRRWPACGQSGASRAYRLDDHNCTAGHR
jgi:hypothetical protein